MEEMNEKTQSMNSEQVFRELRERINAKAENLVKMRITTPGKSRWIAFAFLAVCVAIIIAIEVQSYNSDNFWEFNVWFAVFFGAAIIADRVICVIMRRYLARMKNAVTPVPQYYRAVQRLVITHKLRHWIPLVAGIVCCSFVWYGVDTWSHKLLIDCPLIIGTIWGASMRNWNLGDFCYDVEELGDMIDQESAA